MKFRLQLKPNKSQTKHRPTGEWKAEGGWEKIRTFLRRRKVYFICSTLLRIRAVLPPVQITKNAKRGPCCLLRQFGPAIAIPHQVISNEASDIVASSGARRILCCIHFCAFGRSVFNDFGQHMRTLCQNMVKKLARQQKKTNFNYEKK